MPSNKQPDIDLTLAQLMAEEVAAGTRTMANMVRELNLSWPYFYTLMERFGYTRLDDQGQVITDANVRTAAWTKNPPTTIAATTGDEDADSLLDQANTLLNKAYAELTAQVQRTTAAEKKLNDLLPVYHDTLAKYEKVCAERDQYKRQADLNAKDAGFWRADKKRREQQQLHASVNQMGSLLKDIAANSSRRD